MHLDTETIRAQVSVLQEFVQHKATCDYFKFPLAIVPHCTCGLWSVADRLERTLNGAPNPAPPIAPTDPHSQFLLAQYHAACAWGAYSEAPDGLTDAEAFQRALQAIGHLAVARDLWQAAYYAGKQAEKETPCAE